MFTHVTIYNRMNIYIHVHHFSSIILTGYCSISAFYTSPLRRRSIRLEGPQSISLEGSQSICLEASIHLSGGRVGRALADMYKVPDPSKC